MRYMDEDGVIYDTYANYKPNEMGCTLVDESVIAVVLHKHFVENVTVAEIYRWLLKPLYLYATNGYLILEKRRRIFLLIDIFLNDGCFAIILLKRN